MKDRLGIFFGLWIAASIDVIFVAVVLMFLGALK